MSSIRPAGPPAAEGSLDAVVAVFGIATPLVALAVAIASATIAYLNRQTAKQSADHADRAATASETSATAAGDSLRLATTIDQRQQANESRAQHLHELSVLVQLMEVVGGYESAIGEQSLAAKPHMNDAEFFAWVASFRRTRTEFQTRLLALSLQVPEEEGLAQSVTELTDHAERPVNLRSRGEIPQMYKNLQVELSWAVGRFNVAITEVVARRMGLDEDSLAALQDRVRRAGGQAG